MWLGRVKSDLEIKHTRLSPRPSKAAGEASHRLVLGEAVGRVRRSEAVPPHLRSCFGRLCQARRAGHPIAAGKGG